MAKNNNESKDVTNKNKAASENTLPQNFIQMGEKDESDKKIYLAQKAYNEIHAFTKNKTKNESGGMLIGKVIREFGKTNIVIEAFIEAKHCSATATTLTFTHETWEYVHKIIDSKYNGRQIVGWIHTHPNFGIFLSENDKFIHSNYFQEDFHVAFVVDPIRGEEGFYSWNNDVIEARKGFYIYEKAGKKIKVSNESASSSEAAKDDSSGLKTLIIVLMAILLVLSAFSQVLLYSKVSKLEKQLDMLVQPVYIDEGQMILDDGAVEMLPEDGDIEMYPEDGNVEAIPEEGIEEE